MHRKAGPISAELPRLGWREWVSLPDLGIFSLKAKVDSGAHNCSLHAVDLEYFNRRVDGEGEVEFVRFVTDPNHRGASAEAAVGSRSRREPIQAEARVLDRRAVRSSNGEREIRPVIATKLRLGLHEFQVELNLTDRDLMGFRMLIGRRAMHGRFWIDPSASFIIGRNEHVSGQA